MCLNGIGTFELSGRFVVFNCGETKAILTKHYSEILIAPVLPPVAPSQPGGDDLTDVELSPGESTEVSLPSRGVVKSLTVQERIALGNRIEDIKKNGRDTEARPHNLFVIGWIKYLDESRVDEGRVPRTVGFCKKYNFVTQRFEREADEDYEYGDHGYDQF
jgi:hypothetical protein